MPAEQNMEQQEIPEPGEVEALKKKLAELELSATQFKDQLLRKAAEFENYKKRVENDYTNTVKYSNEELILSLLPVLDDFYRSLRMKEKGGNTTASQSEGGSPQSGAESGLGNGSDFARGIELIYTKLLKILEDEGVRQFDSIGKPFDPGYHDALMQIPRNDLPAHTVVEEVEKGYMFHDKVIRHAKVVVSSETLGDEEIVKDNEQAERQDRRDEKESG